MDVLAHTYVNGALTASPALASSITITQTIAIDIRLPHIHAVTAGNGLAAGQGQRLVSIGNYFDVLLGEPNFSSLFRGDILAIVRGMDTLGLLESYNTTRTSLGMERRSMKLQCFCLGEDHGGGHCGRLALPRRLLILLLLLPMIPVCAIATFPG
jgi:hypothetical protein